MPRAARKLDYTLRIRHVIRNFFAPIVNIYCFFSICKRKKRMKHFLYTNFLSLNLATCCSMQVAYRQLERKLPACHLFHASYYP